MLFLRKFLELDAPNTPSIASMMAMAGVKNDEGSLVMNPNSNSTTHQDSPNGESHNADTPAAQSTTDETSTTAASSTKTPATTELPDSAQPAKDNIPPAPVERPWQEVLKSQKPDTVLKELGLDEQVANFALTAKSLDPKILAFVNHWQGKGNIKEYLEALTVDYTAMSPEDLMRHQLRMDYPEFSPEDFEELYNDRVTDKYKLDPDIYDEKDIKRGRALITADVKKTREELIRKQQEFLLPPPPDTSAAEAEQAQAQSELEQAEKAYFDSMRSDPYMKELFLNKKITIGDGAEAFTYEVQNVDEHWNLMSNAQEWGNLFIKQVVLPNGTLGNVPDVAKQSLVTAFGKDPKGFLKTYADHFQSLGSKAVTDIIDNASTPGATQSPAPVSDGSPASMMASKGRIVHRDD